MLRTAAFCLWAIILALPTGEARGADGAGAIEEVALPKPYACAFHGTGIWETVRLELAPGVPYTEVEGFDSIDLGVPIAKAPAPVGIRLIKGRIELQGLAAATTLPLHFAHPVLLGDLFLPMATTDLNWTDAAAGEMGVEIRLGKMTSEVLKGVDWRQHVRRECTELGIQAAGSFHEFAPIGGRGLNAAARLSAPGPVPLSATPGGAPIASLVPRGWLYPGTTVVERRPEWTRVAVMLDQMFLVGWVPRKVVKPPPKPKMMGDTVVGMGGLGLSGGGPPRWKAPFTCDHRVRLVAEARGQRRVVGTIGPGVQMEVAPGEYKLLGVRVDGINPIEGAQFLIHRADIQGCAAK
jgi:hypothetical protein